MNANILLLEISESKQTEKQLYAEVLEARRAGKSIGFLETRISQEHSFQDELWADWAAEYQTIDRCIKANSAANFDENLPASIDQIAHSIRDGDRLQLIEGILEDHRMIQGSVMDLPHGLEARRNEMLYEIAAENTSVSSYLLSLHDGDKRRALDAYGRLASQVPRSLRPYISLGQIEEELRSATKPTKLVNRRETT